VLTIVGGVLQLPGVDHVLSSFLAPTFAVSHLAHVEPSVGTDYVGLAIGALIAGGAIAIAYRVWVARPQTAPRLQARFRALHTFLVNKWYFDEVIDAVIVRPTLMFGRLAESVLERVVIGEGINDGVAGAVRAGSAAVRRAQTGFVRFYAAAIVVGLAAVALYFLVSSS
jgi:NADH-quinone oxidoreductase subunit L